MGRLVSFVMPVNGSGGKVIQVNVNPDAVRWVRSTQGSEVGKCFIGICGNGAEDGDFIPVDAGLADVLKSLGLGTAVVLKHTTAGPSDFDGLEYHVSTRAVRLVRPGNVDHSFYVVEFMDGTRLNTKKPDALLAAMI